MYVSDHDEFSEVISTIIPPYTNPHTLTCNTQRTDWEGRKVEPVMMELLTDSFCPRAHEVHIPANVYDMEHSVISQMERSGWLLPMEKVMQIEGSLL